MPCVRSDLHTLSPVSASPAHLLETQASPCCLHLWRVPLRVSTSPRLHAGLCCEMPSREGGDAPSPCCAYKGMPTVRGLLYQYVSCFLSCSSYDNNTIFGTKYITKSTPSDYCNPGVPPCPYTLKSVQAASQTGALKADAS